MSDTVILEADNNSPEKRALDNHRPGECESVTELTDDIRVHDLTDDIRVHDLTDDIRVQDITDDIRVRDLFHKLLSEATVHGLPHLHRNHSKSTGITCTYLIYHLIIVTIYFNYFCRIIVLSTNVVCRLLLLFLL